jgi:hypothetical protein
MFSLLLILISGLAAQDVAPQMQPRPLKALHTSDSQIPAFGAFGNTLCDENMATYYHLWMDKYERTVLLRISQSGNESLQYKLPDEFADSTYFRDFSVTPGGDVVALVVDSKFHPIVFSFNSDGQVSTHARLDAPDKMEAERITVFPNGTLLLSGRYIREAPAAVAGKGYVALFHPSGKLLKNLDWLAEKTKIDPPSPGNIPDGGLTVGQDGNVYLLSSSKVLVITPSGKIQREIKFTKPAPEFSADGVQYSEGWLAISLVKRAQPDKPEMQAQYLVLNAQDGSPLGLYEPTEETGNSNLCFSRRDGFLFSKYENKRVKFITAPLR